MRWTRETFTDFCARAAVGTLFAMLSLNLLGDFMRTGRVTGLLLLGSESLVVVFTVARRRAMIIDRSVGAALVTTLSLVGPSMMRTSELGGLLPDSVTTVISGTGLLLVIVGKITLGRSFGLVPANRGIVSGGPYTLVRHPIYTGYLINHIAFAIAHPRPLNWAILLIGDSALVIRALLEERVLSRDAGYQAYCRRVGWPLVPGLF